MSAVEQAINDFSRPFIDKMIHDLLRRDASLVYDLDLTGQAVSATLLQYRDDGQCPTLPVWFRHQIRLLATTQHEDIQLAMRHFGQVTPLHVTFCRSPESFLEFTPDNDVVPPSCGVGRMMRLEERELATSGMCWHDFLLVG